MEINFTNVFPKARSNYISLFWTVFIFTLIQSIGCGEIRPDWDLAVAHGRQVTFFSTGTKSEQVFNIPVPRALTIGSSSSASDSTGAQVNSNSNVNETASNISLVPNWKGHYLKDLALDLSRELIFFTSVPSSKNIFTIAVFNVTSNETFAVFQNASTKIRGMVFHNGSLFWTDSASNSIMRMNTENEINNWSYEIFHQPKQPKIRGLAVDAKSSTFFWATKNGIQYYNGHSEGDVVTGVEVYALTADASHLYWIERIGYIHFDIQRAQLSDFSKKERVYEGKYHDIYALNVLCSDILAWTDTRDSQVVLKNFTKKDKFEGKRQFTPQPYGIVSKSLATQDWDSCKGIPSSSNKEVSPAPASAALAKMTEKTTPLTTTSKIPTKTTETTNKPTTTTTISISDSPVHDGPILKTPGEPVIFLNVSSTSKNSDKVTMSTIVSDDPIEYSTRSSSSFIARNRTVSDSNETSPTDSLTNFQGESTEKTNISSIKWCPKDQMNQCLNGGSCVVVNNKLYCLCLPGFMGRECEKQWSPEDTLAQPFMGDSKIFYIIICSSLSLLVVILLSAVIFLYIKVRKLDKKPKIRRRVIVRSGQRQRGSSVCELIDIENCCNMNECETPCFDRGTPSTSSSTEGEATPKEVPPKKEKLSKDDKQRLIDF